MDLPTQGGLYTNVTLTVPSNLPLGTALLSVVMLQFMGYVPSISFDRIDLADSFNL